MFKRFLLIAVFAVFAGAGYFSLERPGELRDRVGFLFAGTGYSPPEKSVSTQTQSQTVPEKPADTFVLSYKIREGDSLSLIAHRFGIKTDELAKANSIKDGVIYAGEPLDIPLDKRAIVFIHTVSGGETLSSLAELYRTSVHSIMRLNHMQDDAIFASHKLLVSRSPRHQFKVCGFQGRRG